MTRDLSKVLLTGVCAFAFSGPALAGSFTVVHTFKGGRDGMISSAVLTPDEASGFYGTTQYGGSKSCNGGKGCGTVFHIAADGTETILHAFKDGGDGAYPNAGVTFGPDGALYGTTRDGGGHLNCVGHGCGIVYRLTTDGNETVLHAFASYEDGAEPSGSVALDRNGNIYGSTGGGGDPGGDQGEGTIYKISRKGKTTILHAFGQAGDGVRPGANVVLDKQGNVYGAVLGGPIGAGAIFKVTPQGEESLLYSFADGSDGASPLSDLTLDRSGNLYGTTREGGDWGVGTVFRVTLAGVHTVLYSFTGQFGEQADGAEPRGGVIADRKGNLYGATQYYGDDALGTVYKLAPDGTETPLHIFTGGKDGKLPQATLAMDGLGNIYGTTAAGGSTQGICSPNGCGTVFRLPEK